MYCSECGSQIPEGKKFCEQCGTPVKPPKPDFEKQTEYRKETFAKGPGEPPDPAEPLPVEERPPMQQHSADARSAAPAAAAPKKSSRGCLIGGIIVAAIVILLGAFSCSMMSRCSSALSDATSTSNTGSTTTSTHTTQSQTTSPAAGATNGEDTWTVLFYLCGSNLESESGLATFNLRELTETSLGDNVTFAIEAGGARSWQNSTISPAYLTRYSLSGKGFYEEQKLPKASMAEAETFASFVSWGVRTFPADHYMLVVWDHGGGSVYGTCNDELFPYTAGFESDTLTLTEMKAGLETVGATFDVIGFDTCLMATYETAAILSPYADYLVASEEVEPGSGWDYTQWPAWLSSHAAASGDQLGAEICDTYYSKCRAYRSEDMATLSVIDLSKIDAVSASFKGAATEMAAATSDRSALRALYNGVRRTTIFGGDSQYNMVDLGDLMNKTSSVVSEYYDDVIADVDKAVVYQVHGRSHPNVSGMSVFYPLDTSYKSEFYEFLNVAGNVPYAQFVAVMFGLYNAIDWDAYVGAFTPKSAPITESGISIDYEERLNADGQLEVEVTRGLDDIASVAVEMSMYLPDDRAVVYMGTDYDVTGDWSTGVFSDDFYGTWMAIDGYVVSTELLEAADGYNLYAIPVLVNGEETNLIATRDTNTGAYEVICSCPVVDEHSLAAKDMRALENGDEVAFRFAGYLVDSDETVSFKLGSTTWGDGIEMSDVDLEDGVYVLRFVMTDVLGEEHATSMYAQRYENGSITVEPLSEYLAG